MPDYRQTLKRMTPPPIKSGLRKVRAVLEKPPLDEVMLRDYVFVPDDDPTTRLNLLIPTIDPAKAFGGLATGVELFLLLAKRLAEKQALDLRIVLDDFEKPGRVMVDEIGRRVGAATDRLELVSAYDKHRPLPTRRNDVFVSYNFHLTLNVHALLGRQASHFGCAPRPVIYLIQDYEPHMFPFSSTQMAARQAYDAAWPLWGVFNSSQLRGYFDLMGHKAERAYVFEPVVNAKLRPHLDGLEQAAKRRRILVYGRPIERNCLSALIRGLARWSERFPEYRDWEIVSAGYPHKSFPLPDGRRLSSVGKLSLDDYATMLRETAVGVSLMASPHPSYPPLEMAHFGLHTVTNGYTGKNLATAHDNIISVPTLDADVLAEAIATACRRFEDDPRAGARAKSHMPSFLAEDTYPFMERLASDLEDRLPRNAGS